MNRLIVICKEESQANHLAFLLGIPSTLVLPYFDVKCIELINPEAVGGFITLTNPYSENVIELRKSIRSHPVGDKLIQLDFDESGKCEVLKIITNEISNIFSKYRLKDNYYTQIEFRSFYNELKKMLYSYGLTLERGFDFRLAFNALGPVLKSKTNPFELFLNLIKIYKH
jgi:hypothetical protein